MCLRLLFALGLCAAPAPPPTRAVDGQQLVLALIDAAEANDDVAATTLIARGANVNGIDGDGWSPLAHAAANHSAAVVSVLLGARAQTWSPAAQLSPLSIAVAARAGDIVSSLVTSDVSAKAFNDALRLAVAGENLEAAQALLASLDLKRGDVLALRTYARKRLGFDGGQSGEIDLVLLRALIKLCRDDGVEGSERCLSPKVVEAARATEPKPSKPSSGLKLPKRVDE